MSGRKLRRIVAIIPARGGSKRILNKNIVTFLGRPLIWWTIQAAIDSKLFHYVMVSTDSQDIAEISRSSGAQVPYLRDKSDADDYTSVSTATTNALSQLEKHLMCEFDVVIQLMPNCPLRKSIDIVNAYEAFVDRGSNFQISVFRFGWMNPWWAMRVDEPAMKARPLFPECFKSRSQDLEPLYCPTGAIWIAKADELKTQKTFYGEGFTVHPMNWRNAIDIDDRDDLQMAEAVARSD